MSFKIEREFFRFIYKRQLIWYKRFSLKENPPWTTDEILKTFKIINMYRELDRCTIYIIEKLKKVKDRKSLLLNVVFFRFFNKYLLYENLRTNPFKEIDEKSKESIIRKFAELKEKGKPIFNNAYLIAPKGKEEKHVSIMNNLKKLTENSESLIRLIDESKTPEESFGIIKKIPLVGPFLACEIWTDLFYLDFFRQKWTDNDFVNIGPGAKWGLEIIYERKLNKKEQMKKLKHLHKLQGKVLPEIHKELNEKSPWKIIAYEKAYSNYPFLSLTNIEGALCEFRKYVRLKQGKGKKRYFRINPKAI